MYATINMKQSCVQGVLVLQVDDYKLYTSQNYMCACTVMIRQFDCDICSASRGLVNLLCSSYQCCKIYCTSDPAPAPHDDDSCDNLFKLKHCRRKLRNQYYEQVKRVWQWNILGEGLSSALESFNLSEYGNGDPQGETFQQQASENLEGILANWERSFDDKLDDEEFKDLFSKSKKFLTEHKGTVAADNIVLTEIQNKIHYLIALTKIQRQYLSKKCGNVKIHQVCVAVKKLCNILPRAAHVSNQTQSTVEEQAGHSAPGFADGSVRSKRIQTEKGKKKYTMTSFTADLNKVVEFICPNSNRLVQNLETIFSTKSAENMKDPKDVAHWTEACVNVHNTLIEVTSHNTLIEGTSHNTLIEGTSHNTLIKETNTKQLEKSVELYNNLKKMCNNEDFKQAQQNIQTIVRELTSNFVYFFGKVKCLIEEINRLLPKENLKDTSENLTKSFAGSTEMLQLLVEETERCLPNEKLEDRSKNLRKSFAESRKMLQLLTEEIDRHLQKEKEIKDMSENLKKCFAETGKRLQEMGIHLPDVSVGPQGLKIVEELSDILTAGQDFNMLTECHKKVNALINQRIDSEVQHLTAKERKQKCGEIWENCSDSLKKFLRNIEEEVVPCTQCKKDEQCQKANQALREGNLSEDVICYIKSSLRGAYSSKEWQEIRMLKQVVESLKQEQEIKPELRNYLFDLLTKWHEDCTKSKEAESCKFAKKALERADGAYLSPEDQHFILQILKEPEEDPLYNEALTAFKKGPEIEGDLKQHLLHTVTGWYNNFMVKGSFRESEKMADTEDQELCVDIYEAYEAVKSHQSLESLPDSVREFLLKALSNPSDCECCKKILHLSNAYGKLLENEKLTEDQRKYMQEVFLETAVCNSCIGMGTHKKNKESEKKYWEQLHCYLKKTKECERCQDMLQCMDVYKILSGKKELKEDKKTELIKLLQKFEDKWNCMESINCIKAIEMLSDEENEKHKEALDVEEYVMKKLEIVNPCEYDQDGLHEAHESPSREYLRDFLLENSCESCSVLMGQLKVKKTIEENKFLAINLCETMCEEVFPKTVQCKECHQWLDCTKMLEANETLSEDHIKSIYHILNSTEGCKDCRCQGDMDDSKLSGITSNENVAVEPDIMKAIKKCWDRGLQCKDCHRKLIHWENPQSEDNTEEKSRLKTFIGNYLKKFEHRLHCEVCESFFVPKNPIVLEPVPVKAFKIHTSGCSKAEDVKTFGEAAADKLKEQCVSPLKDTFVYPSENKHRKSRGSGKSKQTGAVGERTKGEVRKGYKHGCRDNTRAEPGPTWSEIESTPSDGNGNETASVCPRYARSFSKNDLNESEGINEVVGILQDWGKEHNIPLCILKNYNYGKVEVVFGDFRKTITNSSGDFDILVISRHLGVILVEMKATEFKSTKLKSALGYAQEQLQKNEMVFYEINKDWLCPSRLPVVSLIAVPNITCQQLKDNGICQRDRERILTKCKIQYLQTKPRELDTLIGIPNLNYVFNDDEYCTLLARFLGLDHLTKYHCLDEGLIRNTGKKMLGMLLTQAQKSLIVSGGNKFQILAGDYGTGKSLMLTEKAKLIASTYKKSPEKEKKILVISCTDITVDGSYLKKGQPKDSVQHLRNITGDKTKERKFDYFDHIEFYMAGSFMEGHFGKDVVEKLEAAIAATASLADTEVHILFDEMPLNFMRMFKEKIESLMKTYKSVLKTFWVSIATHSFRVTVLRKQDPTWIKNDCPRGFSFRYLKKNLRVPGKVLDLHKAIEWFNGDGHVDTKRGDIPQGPMPLLYRVPKCDCRSPSRSNNPLTCGCSKRRVKETLKRLFIKIGILEEKNGKTTKSGKTWPRSITMLLFAVESQLFHRDVCKLLLASCEELKIPTEDRTYVSPDAVGRSGEPLGRHHNISNGVDGDIRDKVNCSFQPQADDGKRCPSTSLQGDLKEPKEESPSYQKILLTTETSFIGCETEVLICVDLNGMLHWYPNSKLAYTTSGISRCLSQYIHLTWMPSEAEQMFREQMELLVKDGDVEMKDIEESIKRKETCLEHVLNRILIQEQKVEMPKVGE